MDYTIAPPTEGLVTITLDWKDAEIVARLLGMANAGNLRSHSQNVLTLVDSLVETFGRNNVLEANRFRGVIEGGQVYIVDKEN